MLDPRKNYVELQEDRLTITLAGIRRSVSVRYSNISAAERRRAWSGLPALIVQRLSPTPPPIVLRLKKIDVTLPFSSLGSWRLVRLEAIDPDSFAAALRSRLARYGADTRALS